MKRRRHCGTTVVNAGLITYRVNVSCVCMSDHVVDACGVVCIHCEVDEVS